MELLVNAYIRRALSSPQGFAAVDEGFGGLEDVARDVYGLPVSETAVAHAIADKILGRRWWYTLHQRQTGETTYLEILGGF